MPLYAAGARLAIFFRLEGVIQFEEPLEAQDLFGINPTILKKLHKKYGCTSREYKELLLFGDNLMSPPLTTFDSPPGVELVQIASKNKNNYKNKVPDCVIFSIVKLVEPQIAYMA